MTLMQLSLSMPVVPFYWSNHPHQRNIFIEKQNKDGWIENSFASFKNIRLTSKLKLSNIENAGIV